MARYQGEVVVQLGSRLITNKYQVCCGSSRSSFPSIDKVSIQRRADIIGATINIFCTAIYYLYEGSQHQHQEKDNNSAIVLESEEGQGHSMAVVMMSAIRMTETIKSIIIVTIVISRLCLFFIASIVVFNDHCVGFHQY